MEARKKEQKTKKIKKQRNLIKETEKMENI